MDPSGLIRSYDSRSTSSTAALSRAIMAPQYLPAFSGPPMNTIIAVPHQHQQLSHQSQFNYGNYSGPNPNGMIPAFTNNFIQQRPLPRLMASDGDGGPNMSFSRTTRHGLVEEHHSLSPPIKTEPLWSVPNNSLNFASPNNVPKTESLWSVPNSSPTFSTANANADTPPKSTASTVPGSAAPAIDFGTDVDTLMKAIQARSKTAQPQTSSSIDQSRPVVGVSRTPPHRQSTVQVGGYEESKPKLTRGMLQQDDENMQRGGKKRYLCTIGNCTKAFFQKTHLDIHERAHTGVKPYPCKEPTCGRSFSQLGNLKTHERRHTGERPYQCEICGKRFAQRGNVRAHKIVHDQSKPYLCRLDDCGKQFTQLGNLKSHQNKFHITTIRLLTQKFASAKDGDIFNAGEKELWEYFANLYKNSNKGIKGRGKDRKVGSSNSNSSSMSLKSSMRNLGVSSQTRSNGYSVSGTGRGTMMMSSHGLPQPRVGQAQYEMFDVDEGNHSQCGSHSGSGGSSSTGTCYDDAGNDSFEDSTERANDLAFGDRLY